MKTKLLTALLAITSVCTAHARNVLVTWDPNPPSEAVTNYTLYVGTASGVYTNVYYTGTNTGAIIYWDGPPKTNGLAFPAFYNTNAGPAVFCVVTAANIYGVSLFSEEASVTIPPGKVNIRIVPLDFEGATNGVPVGWNGVPPQFMIEESTDLVCWDPFMQGSILNEAIMDLVLLNRRAEQARFWKLNTP